MISELEMHEDVLSPWRGECNSDQCPWWSSGYDAVQDNERLGFDPPIEAQNFFGSCHFFDPLLHYFKFLFNDHPLRIAVQRTDHLHR